MPTAVIRIEFDAGGIMSDSDYRRGIDRLTDEGLELIVTARGRNTAGCREVEVVSDVDDSATISDINAKCSVAFGTETEVGVVTYISRGTDADAQSVLRRFEVSGTVHREVDADDEEIITVTMSKESERRVPESRLHTALEAALNCEVRIVRY